MIRDDLQDDLESFEEDLRDIQDILDDPSLDEAEKLDAISEIAAPDDDTAESEE